MCEYHEGKNALLRLLSKVRERERKGRSQKKSGLVLLNISLLMHAHFRVCTFFRFLAFGVHGRKLVIPTLCLFLAFAFSFLCIAFRFLWYRRAICSPSPAQSAIFYYYLLFFYYHGFSCYECRVVKLLRYYWS